ncbi:hypothetical protein [Pseudomonas sp. TWI929]|uniref:DUF7693 family protein n=1 Tax=Pseudomonas sp. TWI929 TaxID=3136795 RepID=UPI00320881DF
MIQHDDVPPSTLTAREVGQVLREVVLGRRITIYNDCDELDYCERCVSPEGRRWDFDPGDRTDPIALLSTWEHQTLERMLKAL